MAEQGIRTAILARVGKSGRHSKVKDRKGKANEGQGAGNLRGKAKTEDNVGTGFGAKNETLGMMEARTQDRG